ncbi:nitrogen fixation protein NifZ [Aneurinibacillus terranovensis]|uniref:nitrogen fixation protein NifZ n=1 Tax=Aneurinibacillus terranovensis TaxID=278991 RepID=UPI00040B49B9|nr:nitrogen fixation protein NifZ [Aneurinibacillus terranovensis]
MIYKFELEDTVMTTKDIRNDGTFPGIDKGEIIIRQGQTGVVVDYGYFLQDILVYTVCFDNGYMVGCLERELQFFAGEEKSR